MWESIIEIYRRFFIDSLSYGQILCQPEDSEALELELQSHWAQETLQSKPPEERNDIEERHGEMVGGGFWLMCVSVNARVGSFFDLDVS